MKHSFIAFALIVASQAIAQDNPKSEFARDFLPVWTTSTNNAVEVAQAMPEELYDYKPNDSSMTFREQIVHIGFTVSFLTTYFTSETKPEFNEPDFANKSKADVVAYLQDNILKATEIIFNMTEEASQEEVRVFSGKMMKRYVAILFVQDHLTNHRAKANLYIRINEMKPPAYGFF